MPDKLRYRILRKTNQIRCNLISRKQRHITLDSDTGFLTIFHDYEGVYALPDVRKSSYHGVKFILDVEKKYNIVATYNIVGKLIEDVPEIVSVILADGHELASHSYEHRVMADLSGYEVREDILKTKKIFDSIGVRLAGFRSPQCKWTFRQMRVLLQEGLIWSAEPDEAQFPYLLLQNNHNQLFRMPTIMDDWEYMSQNMDPAQMLSNLIGKVEMLAKKRLYGGIGFHPWIQGETDQRLKVFEKFMEFVSGREDLQVLTFGQMCELIRKHHSTHEIR